METLLALDRWLFLLINGLPHPSLADAFALFLSGVGTAGFIWFVIALVAGHWFFAPVLLAAGSSWVATEIILKPLVARLRPTVEMGATIVGSGSDGYSFPSGHATIAFAMAVVLSKKEPRWKWFFYTLALLISLSRIYLGKHYPLDVVGGGLLGWIIGTLSLTI